jgi:hypothetical protein
MGVPIHAFAWVLERFLLRCGESVPGPSALALGPSFVHQVLGALLRPRTGDHGRPLDQGRTKDFGPGTPDDVLHRFGNAVTVGEPDRAALIARRCMRSQPVVSIGVESGVYAARVPETRRAVESRTTAPWG